MSNVINGWFESIWTAQTKYNYFFHSIFQLKSYGSNSPFDLADDDDDDDDDDMCVCVYTGACVYARELPHII